MHAVVISKEAFVKALGFFYVPDRVASADIPVEIKFIEILWGIDLRSFAIVFLPERVKFPVSTVYCRVAEAAAQTRQETAVLHALQRVVDIGEQQRVGAVVNNSVVNA